MITSATNNAVTTITLNRPDKLNAFSGTMREDLLAALRAADGRVIVITGAGRAFCAGGDVEYMSGLRRAGDVQSFRKLLDAGRDIITTIAALDKPVIACVNGVAAGAGCNLALACDYRIASDAAKFSQSFVKIGLHPDWGGTWSLPRLIGRGRAMEMLMTGRMVDANEALRIGLIERIVPAAELAAETETLAQAIASGPPLAIAGIKRALSQAEVNDLKTQIDLESEHQLRAFTSNDAAEGMNAFFEKRTPMFRGN